MANIEKRTNNKGEVTWRVQIRRKGFPNLQKTFRTESDARIFANQVESSMISMKESMPLEIPKFPLKIWIDRYRKEIGPSRPYWSKERKYFDFWESKLGSLIAIDINPIQIETCADNILNTIGKSGNPLSFETRRKYLLILSSLYGVAIRQWKWATYNPLTGVDLLRKRDRENPVKLDENDPIFIEFRDKFCSLINGKMKAETIGTRESAKKCGLSLHCFQYAMDPKNNITLKNFIKICNGFNLTANVMEK